MKNSMKVSKSKNPAKDISPNKVNWERNINQVRKISILLSIVGLMCIIIIYVFVQSKELQFKLNFFPFFLMGFFQLSFFSFLYLFEPKYIKVTDMGIHLKYRTYINNKRKRPGPELIKWDEIMIIYRDFISKNLIQIIEKNGKKYILYLGPKRILDKICYKFKKHGGIIGTKKKFIVNSNKIENMMEQIQDNKILWEKSFKKPLKKIILCLFIFLIFENLFFCFIIFDMFYIFIIFLSVLGFLLYFWFTSCNQKYIGFSDMGIFFKYRNWIKQKYRKPGPSLMQWKEIKAILIYISNSHKLTIYNKKDYKYNIWTRKIFINKIVYNYKKMGGHIIYI